MKYWLWYALGLSIFLTFVVPPFQKPDETLHFYKTLAVSQGRLFCTKDSSGTFVNPTPSYLVNLPTQLFAQHIGHKPFVPFPPQLFQQVLQTTYQTDLTTNESGSCFLPFLLYLPAASVLAIPVALKLNPLVIFYLGRLANLGLGLGLMLAAYRITPRRQRFLSLVIFLLPMTLFQLGSYSKDVLHLGSGAVALAFLLSFLEHPKKISAKNLCLFFASLAVTILGRPQFMLFGLLGLMIARPNIKEIPIILRLASVGFMFAMVALVGSLLQREVYSAKALSLGNVAPDSYIYPQAQVMMLWEHPTKILSVATQTLATQADYYLRSMIGILGWLDYSLPWFFYPLFIALLAGLFIKNIDMLPTLSKWQFLVLSLVLWGTVPGIFLAMYLYATPVAGSTVKAIQGRYFILLLPLGWWWLGQLAKWCRPQRTIVVLLLLGGSVAYSTLQRYYTSQNYYFPATEYAFSFSESAIKPSPVAVNNALQISLTVDSGRQLRGFKIYPIANKISVNKPHILQVFDASCQRLQSEVIIDVTQLMPDRQFDILLPSFTTQESEVCVKLVPYHFEVREAESLLLLPAKTGSVLVPLYLF